MEYQDQRKLALKLFKGKKYKELRDAIKAGITRAKEEVEQTQKELNKLVNQYKSFLVLKDELEMIRGDIQPLLRKFQELLKITDTIDSIDDMYRRENKEKIV